MKYATCRHCLNSIHEVLSMASGKHEWRDNSAMCANFCAAADGQPHEPEASHQIMLTDSEIATIWGALAADARRAVLARERVAALRDRFAAIHPNNERRVLP